MLGNGPYLVGNGPQVIGNVNGLLGLCRSALCRIWVYVVRHNDAFGIMSHSALCRLAMCRLA